jgi:hypothetical protein
MYRGTERGYRYLVERGYAGRGVEVWRWVITRASDGKMVTAGTSLTPEAARDDALAVINRRANADKEPW